MTFSDIFKSNFLENISGVSILDMVIALVLAFGLGVFIFLIYKKTYNGVMYSSSFGVTLIALTMITTVVILAVTSNVVLSLGMVGALSVRYCIPVLVDCCRHCPCGGHDSASCDWKCHYRPDTACICQQEVSQ